jgi:hypothetical protein
VRKKLPPAVNISDGAANVAADRLGREILLRWLLGDWMRDLRGAGMSEGDAKTKSTQDLHKLGMSKRTACNLLNGIASVPVPLIEKHARGRKLTPAEAKIANSTVAKVWLGFPQDLPRGTRGPKKKQPATQYDASRDRWADPYRRQVLLPLLPKAGAAARRAIGRKTAAHIIKVAQALGVDPAKRLPRAKLQKKMESGAVPDGSTIYRVLKKKNPAD